MINIKEESVTIFYDEEGQCKLFQCKRRFKVEFFQSLLSLKAIGYVRYRSEVTRNRWNIFGNSSDKERKSRAFDSIKRLQKLTLHQDKFLMHICLHITTRHNFLQGLNTLIKEHFAKNAHQTKRSKANRNRKLLFDLNALTELNDLD